MCEQLTLVQIFSELIYPDEGIRWQRRVSLFLAQYTPQTPHFFLQEAHYKRLIVFVSKRSTFCRSSASPAPDERERNRVVGRLFACNRSGERSCQAGPEQFEEPQV